MSRRFFMGQSSGQYQIKQSRPGFDAKDGYLPNLLFDANYIPAYAIRSDQYAVKGTATYNLQTTSFPHYMGRAPDMLLVVAAQRKDSDGGLIAWNGVGQASGTPYGLVVHNNQASIAKNYCGPFVITTAAGGPEAAGSSRVGWWTSFDATNINVHHYTPPNGQVDPPTTTAPPDVPIHLLVKWTGIRFS